MADPAVILYGLIGGLVFGLYGYFTKADPGEPFNWRKLTRTAVIWGAAGVVVVVSGDPLTEGNVVTATATTAVLGEIVDRLWSKARRELGRQGGAATP